MPRKPVVVLNAVPCVTAGGRTVALNAIESLAAERKDLEFIAFIPPDAEYERVCREARIRCFVRGPRRLYQPWRLLFDQVLLPLQLFRLKADALFSLGNLGPVLAPCPHVVLFHNAYYVTDDRLIPGWTGWERLVLRVQTAIFARVAARAVVVCAQTPIMAAALVERLGLERSKIRVIPNGTASIHRRSSQRTGARPATTRGQRTSLLVLSRYYPHKNLEFVCDVATALSEEVRAKVVFLLTIDPASHPRAAALLDRVEREGLDDCVVNLGPIALSDLGALYEDSGALFLPTLLESFSGTYLEAFHYSKPVLTSALDFAIHACGDAALYFDPHSRLDGARAITRFIVEPQLRDELAKRSGSRAFAHSAGWTEIARRLGAILDEALARSYGTSEGAL